MTHALIADLLRRYSPLQSCRESITRAFDVLRATFQAGHKVLLVGNGGSASDADHIAGELLKSLETPKTPTDLPSHLACHVQPAFPAIPLPNLSGPLTAFVNDCEPEWAFAQLVYGLGQSGDLLWALSTSGNSQNVLHAAEVARAKQMAVLGLTGQSGGRLKPLCDVCICVPESGTCNVQELHLPVYHTLCRMLEADFFYNHAKNGDESSETAA